MGNNTVAPADPHQEQDNQPSTSNHPDDPKTAKKPNEIEQLLSRITIAGIEDAYKSKIKAERIMFICAILICIYAMIHTSVLIGHRYVEEGSITINQSIVFDHVAPFPTISLCLPSMWNKEAGDLLVFPENILQQMNRFGITKDEVIDFIISHWSSLSNAHATVRQILQVIGGKVVDASMDVNSRVMVDLTQQPCPRVLSNCAFNGQAFNCCEAVEYMYYDDGACLHISMNRTGRLANSTQVLGGQSMDPSRLSTCGLTFDVSIDPTYVIFDDNVASDGIIIHIDYLPSVFSSPTVVPFGADALIALSPPTKIKEITNCAPPNKLPKLQRYNFYDSHAIACYSNLFNQMIQTYLGCGGMPLLTYVPDNATRCSANVFLMITQMILGNLPQLPKEVEQKFYALYNRNTFRQLYYGNTCPLPCTRWSYPILSNSYGYIRYQHDHKPINTSLSRVRVFFPTASYRLHNEEMVNMVYLAFCKMGGVWGVYLGFSVITVFQALAYGVIIIWKKKRKKNAKMNQAVQTKQL